MSPSAQAFAVAVGEGLEGFLIVAVLIGFLRHTGRYQLVPAVRWGIGLSVPLSIGAAMMFAQASNQALWEGLFAVTCAALVAWLALEVRRANTDGLDISASFTSPAAVLGMLLFTLVLITREGTELVVLLDAVWLQMRSPSATAAALGGMACAGGIAWLWARYGDRLRLWEFLGAAGVFLLVFLVNLIVYGFHELAEARFIPYSDPLHWATEPYGPDGQYGRYFPYLLVVVPLGWLAVSLGRLRYRRDESVGVR